ncbi:MAG TPA: glycoside hydrolase family 13 protein [Nocardioides sp.]|uniref:glycoside hydrolase family 13 protein n=1 Tax=Nocardioides sp. TaxID=35761 RepID=UPI002C1D1D18|nr:glycoside hydrolase family 13 protein [Nocardioides sp.]HQR26353.1 glycoside hydrolase family 13 protein [Nocardioides sp.]
MNDPTPWWRDAVFYQVYVRSFADSDGDGTGDLPGITARLPYLRDLGVDAVWLTPFYLSPHHDHGYDVADHCAVDPLFGTLADAEALIARAHELGLRLVVDVVPNHTSDEHAWFRAALAAAPGSRERARYLFRDGTGPGGAQPPNNWLSVFGGSAWERVVDADGTPEQWYLHLFDRTQPDLDWRNPEVGDLFESVLRFWLDRGVDGFRIDVAHSLFKEEGLRDQVRTGVHQGIPTMSEDGSIVDPHDEDEPMWDQPEVHEVYRRWHRVLADYPGDRMTVAEAWTKTAESMARYVRPDELSQSFNFAWLVAPWSAAAFRAVIRRTVEALREVGASPTWVLSNHDVVRHPTRYGGGARGLARARAATLTMLALPGSAYLYQGEELGLAEVDVAPEHRQDPVWVRSGETGRDGSRVPLPWSGQEPPFGFGPGAGQPWLPQPAEWAELTVERQLADPGSTLAFYRRVLAARRTLARTAGAEVEMLDLGADLVAFARGRLTVVLNCGHRAHRLPDSEVVLTSMPEPPVAPGSAGVGPAGAGPAGGLPPDTAAWLLR